MLPVKLAVLALKSKLTERLLVIILDATLTKLACTKLPKLAFNALLMLPVKLAVPALNSKLTERLLVVILDAILA